MTTPADPRTERILDLARGTIRREAAAVAALEDQIDASLIEVVDAVLATPGKVVTTGAGTSGIIAQRLAHLLSVSGTPSFYLSCQAALHGGMAAVTHDDLVIALSKGGRSNELIDLMERLRHRTVRTIAVTEQPDSPFAHTGSITVHLRTEPADADLGQMVAPDRSDATRRGAAQCSHRRRTPERPPAPSRRGRGTSRSASGVWRPKALLRRASNVALVAISIPIGALRSLVVSSWCASVQYGRQPPIKRVHDWGLAGSADCTAVILDWAEGLKA